MKDEVTCSLTGLQSNHLQTLVDEHSEFVPGFKYMPLFKMGAWDGKTNFVNKKGRTYQTLLPEIIPRLIAWGYKLTLQDDRAPIEIEVPHITADIFKEHGWILREHQVEMVNTTLDKDHKGVILACTGAGKSIVICALSKVYEQIGFRSIVIVPSVDLVVQSMKPYTSVGMDIGQYTGDIKDTEHQHVLTTWQALQNNPALLQTFQVVIIDECLDGNSNITMADGSVKQIQHIQAGDLVVTYNEQTDTFEPNQVLKLHRNLMHSASEKMYELEFDNNVTIHVTGNHKLLTHNRGWVRADELTSIDDVMEIHAG
jgi:hypothetical protein